VIEETVGVDTGDTVGREKLGVVLRRAGEERREENCLEVEGCVVN